MAKFHKAPNFKSVTEERQWTNPHVRFIRKHGRVIPIFNKKRIGQDIEGVGRSTIKSGAILGGAWGLKKVAKKYKINIPLTKIKTPKFKAKSRIGKIAGFGVSKSVSLAKSIMKRPGKFGIALGALGFTAYTAGSEIQMRSEFGKDFFFIKDQWGKGS